MAKERDRGVKMHREVETGRRIHRPGDGGEKEGGCAYETECDDEEHERKVENEEKEKQMK